MTTYWTEHLGVCDICCNPFEKVMYDAKVKSRGYRRPLWGNVCQACFDNDKDAKVGYGYGQKYELQSDSKWLCTDGLK
jgi:hypothetical protein